MKKLYIETNNYNLLTSIKCESKDLSYHDTSKSHGIH